MSMQIYYTFVHNKTYHPYKYVDKYILTYYILVLYITFCSKQYQYRHDIYVVLRHQYKGCRTSWFIRKGS